MTLRSPGTEDAGSEQEEAEGHVPELREAAQAEVGGVPVVREGPARAAGPAVGSGEGVVAPAPPPSFITKSARRRIAQCPNGCGGGIPGTWCQRCGHPLPGEAPSPENGFVAKAARLPCPNGHGTGKPGDSCCTTCGARLYGAPPPRTVVKSAGGEHPLMARWRASHSPAEREALWARIYGDVSAKGAGTG